MMIPSNFEANVARVTDRPAFGKPGEFLYAHFAKVEFGQMLQDEALSRFEELKSRFPSPEWSLTLSRIECTGREIANNL